MTLSYSYGWGEKTNTSFKIVPFIIDRVLLPAEGKKKKDMLLFDETMGGL